MSTIPSLDVIRREPIWAYFDISKHVSFCALWPNSADNKLMIFACLLPEKGFDISCKTIARNVKSYFLGKISKKIFQHVVCWKYFNMSSAESFAQNAKHVLCFTLDVAQLQRFCRYHTYVAGHCDLQSGTELYATETGSQNWRSTCNKRIYGLRESKTSENMPIKFWFS